MANVQSSYSEYERYELNAPSQPVLKLQSEPRGWREDELELDRHKQNHGIFTTITNQLTFYGDAADYIWAAYRIHGKNVDLILTKYKLKENEDGEVVETIDYFGLADYDTIKEADNGVSINFNSNDLEEYIKSHETDDFEIERPKSIDDKDIGELPTETITLLGRTLSAVGLTRVNLSKDLTNGVDQIVFYPDEAGSTFLDPYQRAVIGSGWLSTTISELTTQADERHASVDTQIWQEPSATNMFYVPDDVSSSVQTKLRADYDVELAIPTVMYDAFAIYVHVYEWDAIAEEYNQISLDLWHLNDTEVEVEEISTINALGVEYKRIRFKGKFNVELTWNQGVMFSYAYTENGSDVVPIFKEDLRVSVSSHVDPTNDLKFCFVHDVVDRLVQIITGRQNAFYSKYFGRTEIGYAEDGIGGLIGFMSGFWARGFTTDSERYKAPTVSLKDLIESLKAVFNVGVGVETLNGRQRLRIEDLKYFYQNKVVVRLPQPVQETVELDKDLFFSGTTIGYDKGGDYENQIGLDEPNTQTSTVTPIRKSTNKFERVSKVRSDEYGLELARRLPMFLYPDEDSQYDLHNWFLDIFRDESGDGYRQAKWEDRLQEEPTGINSPETYRSFFFTPLRILLRHGWILKSGMLPYKDKYITYASSKANSNLTTHFIGESQSYTENQDILVDDLQRPRFLPDKVTFTHPIDDSLMDTIKGTTRIEVNGNMEEVPNYYFQFEWVNQKGETRRGYLLNLKPKNSGKFTMQLVNYNI